MPKPPIIGSNPSGSPNVDCAQLLQDIARYQAMVDALTASLSAAPDARSKKQFADELAVAAKVLEDTEANYARHCVRPPRTPKPFKVGPWELVTPLGIDLANGVWHTGSVQCACPLPGGRLLLGTEQGGLWLSVPDGDGGYASQSMSDSWPHWSFNGCVADPANATRVFVGCDPGVNAPGGVYVGHFSVTPASWTFLPLPVGLAAHVAP